MTSNPNNSSVSLSERDLAGLRQNVSLMRSQAKGGRLDPDFLNRQLEKIDDVLVKVQEEQRSRKKEGRFEALYNISRLLGSSLDLQVVLDQIMDAIIQLTGAERGFLMLRDDDGGLTVKVARNFDQQTLNSENFRFSRTIVNQVLDAGEPVVTTNAAEDPRYSQQASIVAQALRSIMATALRVRGHIIGVAYVDNKIITGLFGEEDLAALEALMGQAAVALDNALLFAETDEALARRVEELRQLRRIDLLLSETLDADKAMQYTLEWACRLTNAPGGYMGLLEGDPPTAQPRYRYGAVEDGLSQTLNDVYPQIADVAASARSMHGDDGVLIVPLQREHQVIGVVVLHPQEGATFTDEQQDLIERIVARAAVAIENGRLYAAVRAADKAKSEFVGVVAHDLKTPMTSIGGYASLMLMQQDKLDERQVQFLERIRSTVKRMEVLVSDLSDISRIESGHFFMDETQVAVSDIFQAVKDNTLPQINERHHSFVDQVEPDLPGMWVDYYRLLQVLTNLVSNAYKYTPDGGTITLSARRQGDRIEFTVSDTGIGLPPEAIAKLGTKFWRAEDDFTRTQPGTGLGFAITRALVEQMGSRIAIDSEVGQGSHFTFSIAIQQK
ncbi:MAG: GAF domain-containing protein [Anaerolineae bacterium]|nr:GAF domain-containing protein [Anaerolineae bacterium]